MFWLGRLAGICLLLCSFVTWAAWTASATVLFASVFKSTGVAAGVTGLLSVMMIAAGLTVIILQGLISSNAGENYNDDFFTEPYPAELR